MNDFEPKILEFLRQSVTRFDFGNYRKYSHFVHKLSGIIVDFCA